MVEKPVECAGPHPSNPQIESNPNPSDYPQAERAVAFSADL
jgi:hypothetical protein